MNYKPKFICFEGIDKVGKSTIHQLYDKTVNYADLTVDRMFATYIAYVYRYGRPLDIDKEWFKGFLDNVIIIYLIANPKVLDKRYKNINHEEVNILIDENCFKVALDMLEDWGAKVYIFSTSKDTPKQTVRKIIQKLEKDDKKRIPRSHKI